MIYDALKRAGHTTLVPPLGAPSVVSTAPAMHSPVMAAPVMAAPVMTAPRAASPATAQPVLPMPDAPATPAPYRPLAPRRPQFWPEIIQLYYNIDALRSSDSSIVLQFVSCREKEGTSTIAQQFAAFAAGEENSRVLLVDCDYRSVRSPAPFTGVVRAVPQTLADVAGKDGDIGSAVEPSLQGSNLDQARFADRANSVLHINAAVWSNTLQQLRTRYRYTVLDTPPMSTCPDSMVLSRGCDGVVIVVEAENTRAPVVQSSIDAIERFGGKVLGVVLNRRKFYIPRWLYRKL